MSPRNALDKHCCSIVAEVPCGLPGMLQAFDTNERYHGNEARHLHTVTHSDTERHARNLQEGNKTAHIKSVGYITDSTHSTTTKDGACHVKCDGIKRHSYDPYTQCNRP